MRAEAPVFDDRFQAGRELAKRLLRYRGKKNVFVLAISKEGAEVAFSIAQALKAPLDLVLSQLLAVPQQPRTSFGAVTRDAGVIDAGLVAQWGIKREVIRGLTRDAQHEARRKMILYRGDVPEPNLANKTVIIADDGMGLGFPIISAIVWTKRANPKVIIVAVPASPMFEVQRLRPLVDDVACLIASEGWGIQVATYYRKWKEPADDEIKNLLEAARTPGFDRSRRRIA